MGVTGCQDFHVCHNHVANTRRHSIGDGVDTTVTSVTDVSGCSYSTRRRHVKDGIQRVSRKRIGKRTKAFSLDCAMYTTQSQCRGKRPECVQRSPRHGSPSRLASDRGLESAEAHVLLNAPRSPTSTHRGAPRQTRTTPRRMLCLAKLRSSYWAGRIEQLVHFSYMAIVPRALGARRLSPARPSLYLVETCGTAGACT